MKITLVNDPSKISVGVAAYVRHFPNSPVPCGTCSACCRSEFDLSLITGDDPGQYLTEIGPKTGKPSLKKVDGACVYLKDNRCSIYERRPLTCREFDCRPDVLCGLKTSDLYNRTAWEKFDFSYKEPQDAQLRQCLHLLMRLCIPLIPESNGGAVRAAVLLMQRHLKEQHGDVMLAYAAALVTLGQIYKERRLPLPPFPEELKGVEVN